MDDDVLYRTQALNDSMAEFVSSIEFYAKVLKVPHSEAQVVALIVSGLNAQTRSRLLFANHRIHLVTYIN